MDKALEEIQKICKASNGRSQVFRSGKHLSFPRVYLSHNTPIGSHGHLSCIRHHYTSSAEDASFAVEPGTVEPEAAEPGTAEDLSKIVRSPVRLCPRCRRCIDRVL